MNLSKYPFYAAVLASVVAAGIVAPVAAKERHTRSERRCEDDTPYSNRAVRHEREERRIAREIDHDRQQAHARRETRDYDDDDRDDEEDAD